MLWNIQKLGKIFYPYIIFGDFDLKFAFAKVFRLPVLGFKSIQGYKISILILNDSLKGLCCSHCTQACSYIARQISQRSFIVIPMIKSRVRVSTALFKIVTLWHILAAKSDTKVTICNLNYFAHWVRHISVAVPWRRVPGVRF